MPDPEVVETPDGTDDDAALVAEVEELTKSPVEAQGDKVKNALIAAKRELRAATRRNKELEPVAEQFKRQSEQIANVSPIINAVTSNPKLLAEAMRIANGTTTSRSTTEQPTADEDPDAAAYAEDAGFYLADQITPDVARARRVLTRLDHRMGRQTDDRLRPLASVTLGQRAQQNLREAAAMTDNDGTPLATMESIKEVAGQLPQELLSDPKVIDLVLNSAIGIDRRKGRTPKAQDEPLYLERNSGGRGPRQETIDPSVKNALAKHGISEKDFRASSARLEQAVAGGGRRGIELGKD